MNIQVFGSTSSGNCTLIWDDTTAIMIDCGFSRRYTAQCLEKLKKDFSAISGLFITHSHRDHVNNPVINKLIREKLQWDYSFSLKEGLSRTYEWISERYEL